MKKEEGREDCLHKKGRRRILLVYSLTILMTKFGQKLIKASSIRRRRFFVSLWPYYFDCYEEGGRKKEEEEKDFFSLWPY